MTSDACSTSRMVPHGNVSQFPALFWIAAALTPQHGHLVNPTARDRVAELRHRDRLLAAARVVDSQPAVLRRDAARGARAEAGDRACAARRRWQRLFRTARLGSGDRRLRARRLCRADGPSSDPTPSVPCTPAVFARILVLHIPLVRGRRPGASVAADRATARPGRLRGAGGRRRQSARRRSVLAIWHGEFAPGVDAAPVAPAATPISTAQTNRPLAGEVKR
jgi:hypothetical protein